MRMTVRTILIATIFLAMTIVLAGACAAPGADYRTAKGNANDLSFYQPSITTAPYPLTSARRVRNVILCIGDGMGLSQVAMASAKATGPGGKLHMERLPVAGTVRTYSASSRVTDSAAAGTALATGVKTKNGMIGVDPDERAYLTVLEAAQAKGMPTGLVATSAITHATPASFGAHVRSRKMETDIAEQLIANEINVLFGGGREFFLPKSHPDSGRKDDLDLIAQAREAGYAVVGTASELRSIRGPHALGLFQLEALTTVEPEASLAMLASKAIQVLRHACLESGARDGRPGFFLMIEGSQIDWACHDNDAVNAVRQTLLFDQAVEAAVDFALRDGRTLVVVTADHETGGLTLTAGASEDDGLAPHWSTKGHTGSPVPLWAIGPGAAHFAGVQDNTDIPKKIARLLGLRPFPKRVK